MQRSITDFAGTRRPVRKPVSKKSNRTMSAKWGKKTTRISVAGNKLRRVLVKKKAKTNNQHYWKKA